MYYIPAPKRSQSKPHSNILAGSFDYANQYAAAAAEMAEWIAEGKLKRKYHVVEGITQAPDALLLLFNGGNTGKLCVPKDFLFHCTKHRRLTLTPFAPPVS